jgi:hypothetical protein
MRFVVYSSRMSISCHIPFRVYLRCTTLAFCALLGAAGTATAQDATFLTARTLRDTLVVDLTRHNPDSSIALRHQFVTPGSELLSTSAGRVLRKDVDYTIGYRYGTVRLDSAAVRSIKSGGSAGSTLIISYGFLPFRFQESYYRRKLVTLRDSTGKDSLRVSRLRSSFSVDDIFGPNLQKSGSIVRGFTVGSNRDLSLNSGLRLQLSGKLSNEIDVVAALTDESTPIQPEGTTQTLQEFDKVFVEIRGREFTATLGDFNLDLTGSEFARLSRKLQGAKGNAAYTWGGNSGSVMISGAVPRGKFTTNQFNGTDGMQGPYRLIGKNNERAIVVIAGTEKVYINGELQTRGETNDYTIDYSIAEVTFTPRRLITSASRLTIDFEYSDRQYARSLLAGEATSSLFNGKATLRMSFLREADNQDSPIDLVLSDSARHVLALAGDDQSKAVLSGVTVVDSNGYYVRVDSLLPGGQAVQFYRYAPGRDARFNVAFSSVGAGRGEYTKQSIGVFVWRGAGGGDYMPIRILPLPQLQQTFDTQIGVAPVENLKVTGELALSSFDANRFSSEDDWDNSGHALNFAAGYSPRSVRLFGSDIGGFDLQLKERYVSRRFSFIDRVNDIEFNRKWGIDSSASANEEIQEASLQYLPKSGVAIGGAYGRIDRGAELKSHRVTGTFSSHAPDWPVVDYQIEKITSDERVTDNASTWLRNKGAAEYALGVFVPGFRYEGEKRTLKSAATGTIKGGSFRYDLFAPALALKGMGPFSLSGILEWRTDNLFNNGAVVRESKSFTQTYNGRVGGWNNISMTLDVTLREKKFSEAFRLLGNSDVKSVLVRSQNRYSMPNRAVDADIYYEVATERTARLERVFVKVTQGTGNYRYLGDLNNNGVADEMEFEPVRFDGDYIVVTLPSEQLFPVIDLNTSARVRFTPKSLLTAGSFLTDILSALSTESYVRVDEKSSEPDLKQIYLLHFSRFQKDSTTIAGSTLFSQDVNILEGSPDVSLRLRFSQRTGLNRFTSGTERSYTRDRSIRLRLQLVKEIGTQIDYTNRVDRVGSQQASNRLRDVLSNSIVFDLAYRPEQNVEVGFKIEEGSATDRYQMPNLSADLNTQSLRVIYAFHGEGQLRVEGSREEISLSQALDVFPFELTGGRVDGKTWLWRLAFDYRVTQFVQATVNYDGRSEGGHPPVHTARAEVRAFF